MGAITTKLRLGFVDSETTGLDARIHQAYEVSWALEEPTQEGHRVIRPPNRARVSTIHPPHDLKHAEPRALEIGRYHERGFRPGRQAESPTEMWVRAVHDLRGATLIAANPAFDQEMLTGVFGFRPWHYRLINIEDLAYQEFGWAKPKGQADVALALESLGFEIPPPDHTSKGDVYAVRECYYALMELRARRLG